MTKRDSLMVSKCVKTFKEVRTNFWFFRGEDKQGWERKFKNSSGWGTIFSNLKTTFFLKYTHNVVKVTLNNLYLYFSMLFYKICNILVYFLFVSEILLKRVGRINILIFWQGTKMGGTEVFQSFKGGLTY